MNLAESLHFKQKSLRETVIDALNFIGVKDLSDFDLKEEHFNNPERGIHDPRHLYRVMIASALRPEITMVKTLTMGQEQPRPNGICIALYGTSTNSLRMRRTMSVRLYRSIAQAVIVV